MPNAPVAQLDRVSGFEPGGREFESLRARQLGVAMRYLYFLKEVLFGKGKIGAMLPYGKRVTRVVNQLLIVDDSTRIAEIGPGTGAITESILPKLMSSRSFLLESNEDFVKLLQKQYPQLSVVNGSIKELASVMREEGVTELDFIVCSIPWSLYDDAFQEQALSAVLATLSPKGKFITVFNVHSRFMPNGRRFQRRLKRMFDSVERTGVVWPNVPPAYWYVCEMR